MNLRKGHAVDGFAQCSGESHIRLCHLGNSGGKFRGDQPTRKIARMRKELPW